MNIGVVMKKGVFALWAEWENSPDLRPMVLFKGPPNIVDIRNGIREILIQFEEPNAELIADSFSLDGFPTIPELTVWPIGRTKAIGTNQNCLCFSRLNFDELPQDLKAALGEE